MPETELYGKSHNMTNLRIIKKPNLVGCYDVFADGQELHGVRSIDVHYRPQEPLEADITLTSVTKIDHDLLAKFHFEPTDIRECIKFLALQLQMDDDFRDAWISSIKSALDDLDKFDEDSGEAVSNFNRAGYILERIIE